MSDLSKVEYRIVPTTRYIITKYTAHEDGRAGGETRGQYDNAEVVYEVAYALCKAEHDRLGWPAFDDRIQYPRDPRSCETAKQPIWPEPLNASGPHQG